MQKLKRWASDRPFGMAVLTIILAIFLFDVQGAIIKHMGGRYSVPQISLFRNLFGMGPSLLAMYLSAGWIQSGKPWRLDNWPLAIGRGLMITLAQLCFYFALIKMELATATTLAFAGPLFVTTLSIPLLGHKVGLWRSLAVGVGFLGVVWVMRPSPSDFSNYTLLPIGAAFFYALVSVTSRFFDQSVPTGLINLYSSAVAVLAMIILVVSLGTWTSVPFGVDWLWLGLMGTVGGCAVLLMISAYRIVEPSSLSPFEYFGIPFSFMLGWIFFSESPLDRLFPGVLLIVGSGLLVLWREKKVAS